MKAKCADAKEQSQFAHRIGDIDRGIARGQRAMRAAHDAARAAQHGDVARRVRDGAAR